jgi:hypothetical protein
VIVRPPLLSSAQALLRGMVTLALVGACANNSGPDQSAVPTTTGAVAPTTGQPSRVVAKIHTGSTPCGIVEAAGLVWVTEAQTGTLLGINPTTHAIIGRTTLASTAHDRLSSQPQPAASGWRARTTAVSRS